MIESPYIFLLKFREEIHKEVSLGRDGRGIAV
jgi:hypothetical protein